MADFREGEYIIYQNGETFELGRMIFNIDYAVGVYRSTKIDRLADRLSDRKRREGTE